MIRLQLDACRASEARAQVKARRDEERVRAALTSRGNLATNLHEAAQRTSHDCPVALVARLPHVTEWAEQNERIRRGDWYDDEE